MPNEISTVGITGTDGAVPVYEPTARWTQWSLAQIYLGQEAAGRYVPKIRDYVIDTDSHEIWQCIDINPTSLVPTLERVVRIPDGAMDNTDLLLGVGPGTQSDTYRVYLDKSVIPFTLAVDERLRVAGVNAATCKIFRGSELLGNQEVISAIYDQSGNLLGQAIPLELVAMDGNISIKTVPVCHTMEDLPNGEVVTAIFYSDMGHVVSKRQLLIENTAFIRAQDAPVKYITGISLESPFLSQSDANEIQYPMNVPLIGLNLMGVVHYSDGSLLRMPVDGSKFSIFGFSPYIATIIGQPVPLILNYNLSSDEVVYGAGNVNGARFITRQYRAITVQADGAFTVKLFGYPVWVDDMHGYRLEWFLYNLERNAVFRATPYVRYNLNTAAFDPLAYGIKQNLVVTINLHDVNGAFSSYNHVQTIAISLAGAGSIRTTNWTIQFDPNQDPAFGINNSAQTTFINANLWKVRIGCGETMLADWLDRLYYRAKPLTDEAKEIQAPAPNYFALVFNDTEVEFPISQWNDELTVNSIISNSSTLFVKFFKRTPDNDIQLAVTGLPVYQQN